MAKKFGRSLSFCVADIANGIVNIDDVEMIVTSTKIRNNDEFEKVVRGYSMSYWGNNTQRAIDIAWKLWNSGKIIQPRLTNDNLFHNLINKLKTLIQSFYKILCFLRPILHYILYNVYIFFVK